MNGDLKYQVALKGLYPALTEEELRDAESCLRRYFEFALQIHLENSAPHPDVEVDKAQRFPKIKERSNESLTD